MEFLIRDTHRLRSKQRGFKNSNKKYLFCSLLFAFRKILRREVLFPTSLLIFPIFLDFKSPLPFEMLMIVVVGEQRVDRI